MQETTQLTVWLNLRNQCLRTIRHRLLILISSSSPVLTHTHNILTPFINTWMKEKAKNAADGRQLGKTFPKGTSQEIGHVMGRFADRKMTKGKLSTPLRGQHDLKKYKEL